MSESSTHIHALTFKSLLPLAWVAAAAAAPLAAFYLLFAVGKDDSYSEGLWFKLKGPWGTTPLSLPLSAQFVPAASTQAESATGESLFYEILCCMSVSAMNIHGKSERARMLLYGRHKPTNLCYMLCDCACTHAEQRCFASTNAELHSKWQRCKCILLLRNIGGFHSHH
jgi:hypothetical protein